MEVKLIDLDRIVIETFLDEKKFNPNGKSSVLEFQKTEEYFPETYLYYVDRNSLSKFLEKLPIEERQQYIDVFGVANHFKSEHLDLAVFVEDIDDGDLIFWSRANVHCTGVLFGIDKDHPLRTRIQDEFSLYGKTNQEILRSTLEIKPDTQAYNFDPVSVLFNDKVVDLWLKIVEQNRPDLLAILKEKSILSNSSDEKSLNKDSILNSQFLKDVSPDLNLFNSLDKVVPNKSFNIQKTLRIDLDALLGVYTEKSESDNNVLHERYECYSSIFQEKIVLENGDTILGVVGKELLLLPKNPQSLVNESCGEVKDLILKGLAGKKGLLSDATSRLKDNQQIAEKPLVEPLNQEDGASVKSGLYASMKKMFSSFFHLVDELNDKKVEAVELSTEDSFKMLFKKILKEEYNYHSTFLKFEEDGIIDRTIESVARNMFTPSSESLGEDWKESKDAFRQIGLSSSYRFNYIPSFTELRDSFINKKDLPEINESVFNNVFYNLIVNKSEINFLDVNPDLLIKFSKRVLTEDDLTYDKYADLLIVCAANGAFEDGKNQDLLKGLNTLTKEYKHKTDLYVAACACFPGDDEKLKRVSDVLGIELSNKNPLTNSHFIEISLRDFSTEGLDISLGKNKFSKSDLNTLNFVLNEVVRDLCDPNKKEKEMSYNESAMFIKSIFDGGDFENALLNRKSSYFEISQNILISIPSVSPERISAVEAVLPEIANTIFTTLVSMDNEDKKNMESKITDFTNDCKHMANAYYLNNQMKNEMNTKFNSDKSNQVLDGDGGSNSFKL